MASALRIQSLPNNRAFEPAHDAPNILDETPPLQPGLCALSSPFTGGVSRATRRLMHGVASLAASCAPFSARVNPLFFYPGRLLSLRVHYRV